MTDGCVFCQIIAETAPSSGLIFRGEYVASFAPLDPHVPGHTLFVPRRHIADATEDRWLSGVVQQEAVRYVAEHGWEANVFTSIGARATQTVRHLHWHVIPRGDGDGLGKDWPWMRPEHG